MSSEDEETEERHFTLDSSPFRSVNAQAQEVLNRTAPVVRLSLKLPSYTYVADEIQKALDRELLEGFHPRLIVVGMRWWMALDSGEGRRVFETGKKGATFCGLDIVPDSTVERGVKVLNKYSEEREKFLRRVAAR